MISMTNTSNPMIKAPPGWEELLSYPIGADPWREAPLALPLGELAARTGCLRGCRALNGTMLDVIPLNWALAEIRDFGRLIAAPTVQVRKPVPFIQPHPLSFAFAQQLPQRGRRGRFAPERVQNGFCAVTNRAVRALTYGYLVRSVTIPASLMPYSSNPSVRDVVDASPSGLPSMRFANC